MAATPQIIVNASFPRKVVQGTDLDLRPSNWNWVHCLTLPLEMLQTHQFSHRPFKWIRYAIGVVIGARGDLSTTPDPSGVVNYDANLPADSVNLYYYVDHSEKRKMFPIGPDIIHTQVTTTVSTHRRGSFYDDVVQRDEQKCVWTEIEVMFCDAVHLLAHSKTNDYISTFTHHRGRGNEDNFIEDIDSVRNGIFLVRHAHLILGTQLAFLVTPNFAMNTDDVGGPPEEKRYTAHIIQTCKGRFPSDCVPGTSFQIPESPQSPPDILFDAIYAGFVVLHFGTETMKDSTGKWKDAFYPKGAKTQREADYRTIIDERAAATEKSLEQALDRNERHERRTRRQAHDLIDILTAVPYILVSPDGHQEMMRQAREEAEAAEQRRVQGKVEEWIEHVNIA
ncbi:hypothetical protein EDB84DRAFT_1486912 [Lactarius hengduanensis]|nr:hypothetical protein EDB84DRAFT_1486912 [Lactarius hengduanensis]